MDKDIRESREKLLYPENVQVVVMLGGLGTRLKEITKTCPKPLVNINGKPFFQYQLDLMKVAGFRKFLFCVGYKSEMIEEYFKDGSSQDIEITYVYDGEKLLGTGGAIRRALSQLEEDFMVIYGDSFMDIDYKEILYRYYNGKKNGKKALMTILKNRNEYDKSNVVYKNGEIALYDKKKQIEEMEYIDYGICLYEKKLFEKYREMETFDVAEIQHELSVIGELEACEVEKRFYEIGSPEALEVFKKYAVNRFEKMKPAVFLDRDGVINEIVYNEDTELLDSPMSISQFKMLPQVKESIEQICNKGYYVFVVTNQPSAAKGKTKLSVLYDINHYFNKQMKQFGCEIDDIFMCPHYPQICPLTKEKFLIKECICRKPNNGLIKMAYEKYNIDTSNSYMVGDSHTDIIAGNSVGLKTVLIGQLKCDMCQKLENLKPDIITNSLMEFSKKIKNS